MDCHSRGVLTCQDDEESQCRVAIPKFSYDIYPTTLRSFAMLQDDKLASDFLKN